MESVCGGGSTSPSGTIFRILHIKCAKYGVVWINIGPQNEQGTYSSKGPKSTSNGLKLKLTKSSLFLAFLSIAIFFFGNFLCPNVSYSLIY